MASRSLGQLTIDLVARIAGFEQGLSKAERELDKRAKRMNDVAKKIGAGIGVAISTGLAASAALATGLKVSIDRMDELSKAAQKASLPTEQFTQLAYAGDLADVSLEELTKSLGRLAKAQGDAQAGLKTQKQAFEQLGIAYSTASGSLRNTRDVFLDFADAFQKYKGSPEVVAAGMQIFGRSFQDMIPLLKDGSQGLRNAADEADRLGITLSTKAGQDAEEFNDNLTRLKTSVAGLWQSLASDLLPYLVELTDKFKEGAAEGGSLRTAAHNLAIAIEGVGRAAEAAIGPLARYYDWLQKTGRVEGDTVQELEARRDALVKNRKSFFAELTGATSDIDKEIARIDNRIARLNSPFANVRSGSSSSYDLPDRPPAILPPESGGRSRGGKSEAQRMAEAAARAAQVAAEAQHGWHQSILDMTATLAGPAAEVQREYERNISKLTADFNEGKVALSDYAKAEELYAEQRDRALEAIKATRTPAQQMLEDLRFEAQLLGKSREEQERLTAARYLGAEAATVQGKAALEALEMLQAHSKEVADQIELMDGARDAGREFFDSLREGEGVLKSFENAFGRLADALWDWSTNGLLEGLFGKQGTAQGGSAGGWLSALFSGNGGGTNFWADLFGFASGGFGFAGGGTMAPYSFARVNESGFEMATVGGNDYLLTGNKPVEITPHHKLGRGGVTSNNNFYLAAPASKDTQQQIADRTARELARAQARR